MLMDTMTDRAHFAFTSQLAVLRNCPDVISSILKSGGSVLLAAKVLVISRLLHTTLSKRSNPPPYLETIRRRLATLRRRLLGKIDRQLKNLGLEKESLVEAMCAFSLASSSGLGDVVRHFHHLRLEAISKHMGDDKEIHRNILEALRLYVRTLRDTQAVMPVQLSQGLWKLKAGSIFKSRELYDLIEINLDMHERWIGEDIMNFTPYIRHDDLSATEAESVLKRWARQAVETFLDGLKSRIQYVHDPEELMQLRKKVLELWLGQHQHALGINSAEVLDGLRKVFNEQATALIYTRVRALREVGVTVEEVIQSWQVGVSDALPSLWSPLTISMETNYGGKAFRQRIMDLCTGNNESLRTVTAQYKSWLRSVHVIEEIIQQIKTIKWADNLDDMGDEDDLLDKKQVLLSEDDPQVLEDALVVALDGAFVNLEDYLSSTASEISNAQQGHQAAFLLRIWREIQANLPCSFRNEHLGLETILSLQSVLAKATLASPLDKCSRRLVKAAQSKHFPTRQLWEGDPKLPVLPSPWSYRLLLEVMQSMADYGADIWSPEAVKTVKRATVDRLADLLDKPLETASEVNGHLTGDVNGPADETVEAATEQTNEGSGESDKSKASSQADGRFNGELVHGQTADSDDVGHGKKVQRLFDIFYLSSATAGTEMADKANGLIRCQRPIIEDVTLDARSVERMRRTATEYWKRTSLLFGLLA